MGINYKLKNSIIKNKKFSVNNQNLKLSFFTTLSFWGTYHIKTNSMLNSFLLGKRYGFTILNAEHHVILLKRATKFLFELKKNKQTILFVNEPINRTFDGIIKALAFRALQPCVIGKWPKGLLIKKKKLQYSLLFFNPNKSFFSLREANNTGIPIISLNGLDNQFLKTMYPIFCNNLQGDSIFFNSFLLSNAILEGHLFHYVKQRINVPF